MKKVHVDRNNYVDRYSYNKTLSQQIMLTLIKMSAEQTRQFHDAKKDTVEVFCKLLHNSAFVYCGYMYV